MDLGYIIFVITIVIYVLMGLIYFLAARYGFKLLFPGAGTPEDMSKVLFSSIFNIIQFVIGIGVIAIIAILFVTDSIEPNVGLPVVAAIVGFLLGKGFTIGVPSTLEKGAKSSRK